MDYSGVHEAITGLNIYHFSGGAVLEAGGESELTLGGVLSYGSAPVAREFALPKDLEMPDKVTFRYLCVLAIVGFNFSW